MALDDNRILCGSPSTSRQICKSVACKVVYSTAHCKIDITLVYGALHNEVGGPSGGGGGVGEGAGDCGGGGGGVGEGAGDCGGGGGGGSGGTLPISVCIQSCIEGDEILANPLGNRQSEPKLLIPYCTLVPARSSGPPESPMHIFLVESPAHIIIVELKLEYAVHSSDMSRLACNSSGDLGSSSPVCPQPMAVHVVPRERDEPFGESCTVSVPSSGDSSCNNITS